MPEVNVRRAGMGNLEPCPSNCQPWDAQGRTDKHSPGTPCVGSECDPYHTRPSRDTVIAPPKQAATSPSGVRGRSW
jgi:hypothetical protein